jgi:putative peptide zinc metalloprotease protein
MADQPQAAVSDLERRKQVRVLLRDDLSITRQKYEGRTYYVVKDPVSLRYYRFKEQERFLLDLMNGQHTLDDAQKAFEKRFRPERLTLEDLEAFTSQLLQAGLAQNESPNAGKQLFDRFKKRRRSVITQALLNILYIKIPVFDPDHVLEKMKRPLRFIFTSSFLAVSLTIMLAAVLLIASQWNTFYEALLHYQENFNFHTVLYLWAALGLVKVIHEFGHGLSCKSFGGEVHEMGLLFLVFSPCMYCNVSDSWTLPSKWKRIIISGAGIYVEVIIASICTFIWYFSQKGTFLSDFLMNVIILCSVSTIIFNANPLMRFDGYYMLADWLEIPNLRDRSNKYLQHLAQEYLLGMEVQPEPYMDLNRKILFITYAITSYLYRWFVTFGILYFMYTFLKPYKLGAISYLLGTGALGTMVGYPIYRLGKALHRRGRVPDMKPVRVWILTGMVVAALIAFFVIPFPMRVKGLALVQLDAKKVDPLVVPPIGGYLEELYVNDGQDVKQGDPIALLSNPDLEIRLKVTDNELASRRMQIDALNASINALPFARVHLGSQLAEAQSGQRLLVEQKRFMDEQAKGLLLCAPCDGKVRKLVRVEEIGKAMEKGAPICEIGPEDALQVIMLVDPSDSKLVNVGDEAWIRIHGRGYNYFAGKVVSVSGKEATEVPPQFSKNHGGEIVTEPDPQRQVEKPVNQLYLVTVEFTEKDQGIQPGVMSRCKIIVEPKTLFWRLRRYLAMTFNLGL